MTIKGKEYIKRIAEKALMGDNKNKERIKKLMNFFLIELSINYSFDEFISLILEDRLNIKEICFLFKKNQNIELLNLFLPSKEKYSVDCKGNLLISLGGPYLGTLNPDLNDDFWLNIDKIYEEYIFNLNKIFKSKYNFNFEIGYSDNGVKDDINFLFSTIGIIINNETDVFCLFNNLENIKNDFKNEEKTFLTNLNNKYS